MGILIASFLLLGIICFAVVTVELIYGFILNVKAVKRARANYIRNKDRKMFDRLQKELGYDKQ